LKLASNTCLERSLFSERERLVGGNLAKGGNGLHQALKRKGDVGVGIVRSVGLKLQKSHGSFLSIRPAKLGPPTKKRR